MKKAIIAFTVLLVLSLVSTVCFAAATGTKVVKAAAEYFAENDIHGIEDIDKLEEKFEDFVHNKLGVDFDVNINYNNGENVEDEQTVKDASVFEPTAQSEPETSQEVTEQTEEAVNQ